MSESLGEALPKEIERVQKLLALYSGVPTGVFAVMKMQQDLQRANRAISNGDLPEMIAVYQDLKNYKE